MAVVVRDFFKEKKYPFILTLSIFLISIAIFLLTNTSYSNPLLFYSNNIKHQLPFNFNPSPESTSSISNPKQQKLPQKVTNITAPKNEGLSQKEEALDNVSFDWKLCKDPMVTVDYIPCLDNYKAIMALKSRRHMEHRERHCPDTTSLRCLLPLPKGYTVPIPWPKSRDMVRLRYFVFFVMCVCDCFEVVLVSFRGSLD